MSSRDGERLARLARTLDAPPRQLWVAAARLARVQVVGSLDTMQGLAILHDASAPLAATERVAGLLATPIASFAQDDVDRALASIAPVRSAQDT